MDLMGVLNICKLPGMSSHQVVATVRRIAGLQRVGHAGTLDPAACGVLPVCLGRATRLAGYIADAQKTYRAEILFGIVTDADDAEGQVIARRQAGDLQEAQALAALPRFTGILLQRPPIYSAVQIGGRRAYELARRGEIEELPAREVTVYAFTPVRFLHGAHPRLLADITCSKGAYIRALARDLGEALGVGASLSFLARTRAGSCGLEDSVTLDEVAEAAEADRWGDALLPADAPLQHLPALALREDARRYRHGSAVPAGASPGLYRVYEDDLFLGLGRVADGLLTPTVNLEAE